MPEPALSAVECDGEALLGERHGQRQPHVAQADDGYRGGAVMDFGEKLLFHRVLCCQAVMVRRITRE